MAELSMLLKSIIVLFGIITFIFLIMTDECKVDIFGLILKGLLLTVAIASLLVGIFLLTCAGYNAFTGGSIGAVTICVALALLDALFLKEVVEMLQEMD